MINFEVTLVEKSVITVVYKLGGDIVTKKVQDILYLTILIFSIIAKAVLSEMVFDSLFYFMTIPLNQYHLQFRTYVCIIKIEAYVLEV